MTYRTPYLTEHRLGEILSSGKYTFIHNKTVPGAGRRFRPDFRNDELKLIVEYDGFMHFTEQKNVLSDLEKNSLYRSLGYTVIRIPYFVQLTDQMYDYYFTNNEFHLEVDKRLLETDYPHGFIDDNVHFPAEYCLAGLRAYGDILSSLPRNVVRDINHSLHEFDAPYDMKFPPTYMLSESYRNILSFSLLDWFEVSLGTDQFEAMTGYAINTHEFGVLSDIRKIVVENVLNAEVGSFVSYDGSVMKSTFFLPDKRLAVFVEEPDCNGMETFSSVYYMEKISRMGYNVVFIPVNWDERLDQFRYEVLSDWLINNYNIGEFNGY